MSERDEWLAWRRGGIGASDAAALVGLSRYGSPWSLWAEKVGLTVDRPQSQRQRIGQILEPAIAQLFHETTGLHVAHAQSRCQHPDLPWARCTVDGFVFDTAAAATAPAPLLDDVLGVHEIKTDARYGWDDVPVDIRAQCIWQMAVTQTEHCWISALYGGFGFGVWELRWDADARADWELMRAAGERLWHEHVVTGVPPDVDGSDATYRALLQVYPDAEPGQRVSIDHLRDEIAERAQLTEQAKQIDKRLDELRNVLIESIGDAELGTVDGEPVLSARWSERHSVDVAAVRADHGSHYDQTTRVRIVRAASKRDRRRSAA